MKGTKYNEFLNIEISLNEVEEICKKLKKDKAAGPDTISNNMIRHMTHDTMTMTREILEAVRKNKKIPDT